MALEKHPESAQLLGQLRGLPLHFDVFKSCLTAKWMLNELEAVPDCYHWLFGELVIPEANAESREHKKKSEKVNYAGSDMEVMEFASNIYEYLKSNWTFPFST